MVSTGISMTWTVLSWSGGPSNPGRLKLGVHSTSVRSRTWTKNMHCAKKPVTTMLTYPWKCTVLHCNHLGNTWKPLVLMTQHFDYCPSASEGDNQNVRPSAPVVSRCFPGGYNVKLYISRGMVSMVVTGFFAQWWMWVSKYKSQYSVLWPYFPWELPQWYKIILWFICSAWHHCNIAFTVSRYTTKIYMLFAWNGVISFTVWESVQIIK